MSINKFAPDEIKSLIKLHTSTIYQWAGAAASAGVKISPNSKEAVLTLICRLHELVEALPVTAPVTHHSTIEHESRE